MTSALACRIVTRSPSHILPGYSWCEVYVANSPQYPAPDYETTWQRSPDIAQTMAKNWATSLGYAVEAIT
jgi:hypothetical protein